jgi:hypothetical protein
VKAASPAGQAAPLDPQGPVAQRLDSAGTVFSSRVFDAEDLDQQNTG